MPPRSASSCSRLAPRSARRRAKGLDAGDLVLRRAGGALGGVAVLADRPSSRERPTSAVRVSRRSRPVASSRRSTCASSRTLPASSRAAVAASLAVAACWRAPSASSAACSSCSRATWSSPPSRARPARSSSWSARPVAGGLVGGPGEPGDLLEPVARRPDLGEHGAGAAVDLGDALGRPRRRPAGRLGLGRARSRPARGRRRPRSPGPAAAWSAGLAACRPLELAGVELVDARPEGLDVGGGERRVDAARARRRARRGASPSTWRAQGRPRSNRPGRRGRRRGARRRASSSSPADGARSSGSQLGARRRSTASAAARARRGRRRARARSASSSSRPRRRGRDLLELRRAARRAPRGRRRRGGPRRTGARSCVELLAGRHAVAERVERAADRVQVALAAQPSASVASCSRIASRSVRPTPPSRRASKARWRSSKSPRDGALAQVLELAAQLVDLPDRGRRPGARRGRGAGPRARGARRRGRPAGRSGGGAPRATASGPASRSAATSARSAVELVAPRRRGAQRVERRAARRARPRRPARPRAARAARAEGQLVPGGASWPRRAASRSSTALSSTSTRASVEIERAWSLVAQRLGRRASASASCGSGGGQLGARAPRCSATARAPARAGDLGAERLDGRAGAGLGAADGLQLGAQRGAVLAGADGLLAQLVGDGAQGVEAGAGLLGLALQLLQAAAVLARERLALGALDRDLADALAQPLGVALDGVDALQRGGQLGARRPRARGRARARRARAPRSARRGRPRTPRARASRRSSVACRSALADLGVAARSSRRRSSSASSAARGSAASAPRPRAPRGAPRRGPRRPRRPRR